jgi:programmed cell death 6-interacting protein
LHLPFEWKDAFAPAGGERKIAASSSIAKEKLAMLYNLGACESALAAKSDRSTLDGLKVASAAFQRAAGYFQFLGQCDDGKKVNETMGAGSGEPTAATATATTGIDRIEADLSGKMAAILVALCLAQAQESVFEAAKLSDKSNGVLAKLAIACADLYEEVHEKLSSSLRGNPKAPVTQERYVPKMWATTTFIKAAIFNAEATARVCETLVNDEETIGSAITLLTRSKERLESALRRAEIPTAPKPPKLVVEAAENILRDSIKFELGKAVRDNECVYMAKVPSYEALQRLHDDASEKVTNPLHSKFGAKMVKPTSGADIEVFLDPSNKDDVSALFARIVPEDCASSASLYADKVDRLVREQLEQLAFASDEARVALREMELPETYNALNRPIQLSEELDAEVKFFRDQDGGIDAMRETLSFSRDVSKHCETELEEITSLLDIEMKAGGAARNAYGSHKYRALPSDAETTRWRRDLETFVNNSKLAAESDEKLRSEFARCEPILQMTTSESIAQNAPKLEPPMLLVEDAESLAKEVRLGLERIERIGREREEIEDAMKAVKASDDILPTLVGKMKSSVDSETAQGKIFSDELGKYDELIAAAQNNTFAQADALAELRKSYIKFSDMYNVSSLREKEIKRDNTLREALRIAAELSRGIQQGVRFYGGFSDAIESLKNEVKVWCENRENERKRIVERLRREEEEEAERARMAEEVRIKTEQMRVQNERSVAHATVTTSYYPGSEYPPHHQLQQQPPPPSSYYPPPPQQQQQHYPPTQSSYYPPQQQQHHQQQQHYPRHPPPPADDGYYNPGGDEGGNFSAYDLPSAPRGR